MKGESWEELKNYEVTGRQTCNETWVETHLVNSASPLAQGDSSEPPGSAISEKSVVQIKDILFQGDLR